MAKMKQIVECVPNFSEGRDLNIIRQITDEVESVKGVKLLDVDPGEATNRTVVTFVGEPDNVVEAAFKAVAKAAQLIDMRQHHGAHPRIGATDVLPIVPVSGITLEECAEISRNLAKRIANELNIPCYCYEAAAFTPKRQNLAICRKGEYEGIAERIDNDAEAPDFGRRPYDEQVARTGCTVVGARDFLIAVNFNLNTTSTRRANAIAFDVREKGRPMREGNPITGKKLQYGIAQVSMNITNINVTPLHKAFDEVCRCAQNRGLRVTGTEIVGLVPERTLIEAGRYFLAKQQRSAGIPKKDVLDIAIKSLGLSDLKEFKPEEKIIEYVMAADDEKHNLLVDLTVKGFAEETSRESPAPGGGSVSAYMGALSASLVTMVANLSSHKPGWDEQWQQFANVAEEGMALQERLLHLVDEDTEAFNRIMAAFSMPKNTPEEKAARSEAIQTATLFAAEVPLDTMKTSFEVFDVCRKMVETGNPNSVSDAGVGALAARAAVLGAGMNVKINAGSLKDRAKAEALIGEANELIAKANKEEAEITALVESKL